MGLFFLLKPLSNLSMLKIKQLLLINTCLIITSEKKIDILL